MRFIEHVSMDKYVLYNKFSTEEFALVFMSAAGETPGPRHVIVHCKQYDTIVSVLIVLHWFTFYCCQIVSKNA